MPLLKDGEPYSLTADDKKKVRQEVGAKFPVKFKMPPSWFKPDPINKGRVIRPPGVNITTKALIADDGEHVMWTYGRTFKRHKDGKTLISSDGLISFETEMSVGENQMDLLFYLLFCNPAREGSKHKSDTTKTMYVVENIEKESEVMLEKESMLAAAVHYITNEWPENRVRKIAAATGIPFALDKTLIGNKEIRARMIHAVKTSEEALKKFDQLSRLEDEIQIRATIQHLLDTNKIVYDDAWYLLTQNINTNKMEKTRKVCDIQPGRNAIDSIVFFLKTSPESWEVVAKHNGTVDEKLGEDQVAPATKNKKKAE